MDVEVEANGGQATLRVTGELDAATAPEFDAAIGPLLAGGVTDITIDVAGLAFLDSSGLRSLVRAREQLLPDGGVVRLLDPAPAVRRVLEITRLEEAFGLG